MALVQCFLINFMMDDLSIVECGVLKFSTITVLSIPSDLLVFADICRCSDIGCLYIYDIFSWWFDACIIMQWSSLSLVIVFVLLSIICVFDHFFLSKWIVTTFSSLISLILSSCLSLMLILLIVFLFLLFFKFPSLCSQIPDFCMALLWFLSLG